VLVDWRPKASDRIVLFESNDYLLFCSKVFTFDHAANPVVEGLPEFEQFLEA
jgi:hypothetical protein